MESTGLRGTKLQGTEIIKIEKQDLQAVILDVNSDIAKKLILLQRDL